MLGPVGTQELLVIFMMILFIFGAKKIPQIARSLGRSVNEFSRGRQEGAGSPAEDPAHDRSPA